MTWSRIEPGIFRIQVYTNTTTPTFLRATSAEGIDLGSQAVSDNPNDRLSADYTLKPSNSCQLRKSMIYWWRVEFGSVASLNVQLRSAKDKPAGVQSSLFCSGEISAWLHKHLLGLGTVIS